MQKSQLITGVAVAAGLAVVALFFIFNGSLDATGSMSTTGTDTSGLIVQDEVLGTGAAAAAGDVVTVNYTGKLEDGTVFDTSVGKTPIDFPLGAGYVIPGWEQGLVGMKEGGKRLLTIPSSLAYGSEGRGTIPPNATLIFEVELVKVQKGAATEPTAPLQQ